jgi:hypothetical protein
MNLYRSSHLSPMDIGAFINEECNTIPLKVILRLDYNKSIKCLYRDITVYHGARRRSCSGLYIDESKSYVHKHNDKTYEYMAKVYVPCADDTVWIYRFTLLIRNTYEQQ